MASSEGIEAATAVTHAGLGASIVFTDGEAAIQTWDAGVSSRRDLDAAAVARSAIEKARSLRGASAPTGGTADLILSPDAVQSLVVGLVESAVDGDTAARGKSVWSDALGEQVAHAGLRLLDDPGAPDAVAVGPWDDEGLPVRRTDVITGGTLRAFLFDSWDAHRHDRQSTHHGQRGDFKSLPGTGAHHWTLRHDRAQDLDGLVAGIDQGYLVDSLLGAHTANATTGDFSVTAPHVWRIEAGALAGPCKEIAVAGNLPALLRHADGATRKTKLFDGASLPHLRLRDVAVSC